MGPTHQPRRLKRIEMWTPLLYTGWARKCHFRCRLEIVTIDLDTKISHGKFLVRG
jgi:hypothetical protein